MDAHSPKPAPGRRRWRAVAVALLAAAVVAFYFWIVGGDERIEWRGAKRDYYSLLVHSLLRGETALDVPVAPQLAKLANPYDPAQNRGLGTHDLSYYRGRYYLYCGITPALLLLIPYHLLTAGSDLPQNLANACFCALGFLAVTAVLVAVRRRHFPQASFGLLLLGVLAAGVGSFTLATMSRPSFWELPIAAGYGCAMVALWGVYEALHREHPGRWLILAGFSYGLAVGARPIYAVAGFVLLGPLAFLGARGRRGAPGTHTGGWWLQAAAFLVPVALCAAGLAFYNYCRFGNPLEFGLRYQLTGIDQFHARLFGVDYAWFNWRAYFWEPAQWSRYFPFIRVPDLPAAPPGYYGTEFVYGILTNLPATWLVPWAIAAGFVGKQRPSADCTAFVLTAAGFTTISAGVLLFFNTASARYMVDFVPGFVLLGAMGALGWDHRLAGASRGTKMAIRSALAAALAATAFVGLMAGFQLHGLLRLQRPAAYAALERVFNQPVYWFERLAGTRYGPLQLRLRLPRDRIGKLEPLVVTGWAYEADFVFLYYPDREHLQVGFDHTSHGMVMSSPFPVDYSTDHTVSVELGSLYPPATHPFFAGMAPAQIDAYRRYCHVTFDNRTVLELTAAFYDSSPGHLGVGRNIVSDAYGRQFTGQILEIRRLAPPARVSLDFLGAYQHPLALRVRFPEVRGPFPVREPILVSGEPGRGNALYVEYLAPGRIRFGYDHWGHGAYESAPVDLDVVQTHLLQIDYGALHHSTDPVGAIERAPLVIQLDGREVWRAQLPYYTCRATSIVIGNNAIGSSTCGVQFSGGLLVPLPASSATSP